VGEVLGGVLFSGRGPGIPVKIHAVTDVRTQLKNNFEAAGINQTLHKISLEITAEIDILIPGETLRATVVTEVAVAETIVVGAVPNVYANNI
jgi:sporulation protein YunB